FARLLRGDALENAPVLGELMYQSHASYSACGLGSEGTDRLVELARAAGARRGIFGAKITGGGSGGTVAVLARRDAEDAVREIADRYARERGIEPTLFGGSSSGALAFRHRVLKP
ncbi:MAG TPA: GHMP kinase, partial [Vicinamibacteria bacterium]|nr:GHMP kinase [Vicinamibacteria bacterium]